MSDNDLYQTQNKNFNENKANETLNNNNTILKKNQFSLPKKSYEEQMDTYINNNFN